MKCSEVVMIGRATCYSPNSVEKDRAILESVRTRLGGVIIQEESIDSDSLGNPTLILSMGRMPQTLSLLEKMEEGGVRVVNPSGGVERCQRSRLEKLMLEHHIPMAPHDGPCGYWLKRGDGAAQSKEDVVFCRNKEELEAAKQRFEERGIKEIITSAHVVGDVVKFYGVSSMTDTTHEYDQAPEGFFRIYYPGDDGISKFGDESINGQPHHYPFPVDELRATADKLSRLLGTPIYGGDAIVKADGTFCIIDFNDWPSFSRCREDAADAIADYARQLMSRQ